MRLDDPAYSNSYLHDAAVHILAQKKKGQYQGREFWGCSDYPKCNGLRRIEP